MPRPRVSRFVATYKPRAMTPSASCTQTYGSEKRPAMKSQVKRALTTATAPNKPAACPFCLRVISLAPAMRLDRAVGGEEAERADREEVDDVLEIERPAAERVEVADGAEVGDHLADRAFRLLGGPADDPGHEQDDERDERRHHLAHG